MSEATMNVEFLQHPLQYESTIASVAWDYDAGWVRVDDRAMAFSILVERMHPMASTRFVNMWWLHQVHPFGSDSQRQFGPTINLSFWEAYRS